MPNTTNFNWTTPADTDLVKDGALAIRTLANGIDTSLVDLKGGTTGQVLAKATNTDLDFSWVAVDDTNAIQNAIIDAKGDLIVGTAADTPARLAIGGTNGHVLTVDSGETSGMKWAAVPSGGMTLLETLTLSGASVTSSSISQSYKHLQVIIRNARPATDGTYLGFRMNGATTGYASESGTQSSGNFNGVAIYWGDQIDNGTSDLTAWINIYDYTNTTTWKTVDLWGYGNSSATPANWSSRGGKAIFNTTSAITTITLLPDSGNWTSGSALIYGVS